MLLLLLTTDDCLLHATRANGSSKVKRSESRDRPTIVFLQKRSLINYLSQCLLAKLNQNKDQSHQTQVFELCLKKKTDCELFSIYLRPSVCLMQSDNTDDTISWLTASSISTLQPSPHPTPHSPYRISILVFNPKVSWCCSLIHTSWVAGNHRT